MQIEDFEKNYWDLRENGLGSRKGFLIGLVRGLRVADNNIQEV